MSHAKKRHGYKVERNGVQLIMHRYIYELFSGNKIEDGLVIRHKCDNSFCINPNHLETGTHQDNVMDRVSRGRSAIGINNGRSKLDEESVISIRMNTTNSPTELSKIFGVDRGTIKNIWSGKKWKHILSDIDYQSLERKSDADHNKMFSEEDIRYIRNSMKTGISLAKEYGVGTTTISKIRNFISYANVR